MSTNQMGLHLLALFVPSILGVVHRYGQIGLDVMNIIKEPFLAQFAHLRR